MNRLDALRVIDDVYRDNPLVITCGATAREMASLNQRDSHLYLLDSMGAAAAVGVGLALAGRGPVGAIEGDGSLLMGFSVLPTIRYLAPDRYALIVLDNHEHASAARIPTQSTTVDLASAIRGVGLPVETATDTDGLRVALEKALAREDGPTVVVATIEGGNSPDIALLLQDPVVIGERFVRSLKGNR
jgi:thiamine pyrophosphate-dependent acetolactate synthase large subunit-like protein